MSPELQADLAACADVLHVHSRSFSTAARLLPAAVRRQAIATYAFCRHADDDVDDADSAADGAERHRRTRERLKAIYRGEPADTASARAFSWVVDLAGIPSSEPEALLDGMAQDLGPVRIANGAELRAYSYRAAGVVGRMMARIMKCADSESLARATDLGIAMQLTNIARDVREDSVRNRVYLPGDWLREAGGSFQDVFTRPFGAAVATVNERILTMADELYDSGIAGIQRLPRSCRPAILAAALLYREIGYEVARAGFAPERRVRVGKARQGSLVVRALASSLLGRRVPSRETFADTVVGGSRTR